MTNIGEIGLNLGLRNKSRQAFLLASELCGFTVISTKARDKMLESAPWARPHFWMMEKVNPGNGNGSSAVDEHLSYDNASLADLRRRYSGRPATDHIQWGRSDVEARVVLKAFRGDNLYIYQSRKYPAWVFYATAGYAKEIDRLGLWNRLEEDGRWGAELYDFHGKAVSRDLVDSIIELNFLDRHLGISGDRVAQVLDVGAGYGRLAHRMATAFPNLGGYYCIDAVPESTFISEYYLKCREMTGRCTVVPLDKLDQLRSVKIDLAVNIHSFPECRIGVVDWWLQRLREMEIPWLFIATDPTLGLTSNEGRKPRKDFRQLIEKSGFKLVAKESKFESAPALENCGLYPADYYLFSRG